MTSNIFSYATKTVSTICQKTALFLQYTFIQGDQNVSVHLMIVL